MSETNTSLTTSETEALIAQLPDIPENVHYIFDGIINGLLDQFISLFGILGNSLTIVVLSYNGFSNPTDIVLTGLAASDLFYSVTYSLFRIRSFITKCDLYMGYTYFTYLFLSIYPWNQTSMLISIELVCIIAIERMLAVWFPFHVYRILSPYRMKGIVVGVFIFMPLLILPFAATVQYGETTIHATNRTVGIVLYTEYFLNNVDSFNIYRNYFLLFVTAILPITAITICSLLIIIKLAITAKIFSKLDGSISTKRVRDLKSVKKTLLICFSLMVLVIVPINTIDIYYESGQRFPFGERTFDLMMSFVRIIIQINASSNFIIYVTGNSKFLKTYRKLFGLCIDGKMKF